MSAPGPAARYVIDCADLRCEFREEDLSKADAQQLADFHIELFRHQVLIIPEEDVL